MDNAWVAATYLGFPNLVIDIDFALEYPSEVKDKHLLIISLSVLADLKGKKTCELKNKL